KAIHGGKNKNDRIDSEKLAHLLRTNLIPPAYVYPAEQRPLRALLRQRILYVWNRSQLLARIQSHQLAHNRPTLRQTRPNREPWEEKLLAQEDNPIRQLALQNDLALIGHYDTQLTTLEGQLQQLTRQHAPRDYTLLQTVPGIGPLAQRLEARLGNKFKANTVLAIKLARAVYFMLRDHTVFDPERLVAALTHK